MWYLGYDKLRTVVNCWIKLLITIQMWYLGYNYLRIVVNCWIKLVFTIQMWYISRSFLVEYYQFPSSTKNNYSNSWHGALLVGSWHRLTSVDTVDRTSRAMIWTNHACDDVNCLIHILCWSEPTVLAIMWTAWFTFCAVIWSGNNCSREQLFLCLREQLFSRTAVRANSCSSEQLFANGSGYLDMVTKICVTKFIVNQISWP